MNYFIDPETITSLCSVSNENIRQTSGENSNFDACENTHEKAGSRQPIWTKILSKGKEIWRKIKPVLSELTFFFTLAASLVKAGTKFGTQCKNLETVFA